MLLEFRPMLQKYRPMLHGARLQIPRVPTEEEAARHPQQAHSRLQLPLSNYCSLSRGAVEPWSRGAVEPWSRGASDGDGWQHGSEVSKGYLK